MNSHAFTRRLQACLFVFTLLLLSVATVSANAAWAFQGDEAVKKPGNGNGGGNGNGNGGNGNGNGNGGNGNGNGGGGGGNRGELKLEMRPSTWNTNWVNAAGTVQAFVRGKDAGKIAPSSVELVGEGGEAIEPRSARVNGGQLVAHFSKADAFELLEEPRSGERHEVTLRFMVGEERKELTATVRIVGPDPGEEPGGEEPFRPRLRLDIKPDDWNVNWEGSAGLLHVFIRGTGLSEIDLDSIRLVGDDPEAEPLEPLDVRRVGRQIVARFSKSAAYATLDDPDSGETHTVKIVFAVEGEEEDSELSEDVRIIGPRR
jgi:hypothetical protein